ncbi:hypothetical protein [Neobacillus sp. 19]|uniref:hypothetical protein n=1 Tax=Neobacillus sp. 19 TaxID=3394458 RepID=UPI003BF72A79
MFFKENDVYKIVKLRQEEVEKKARDAWKYVDLNHESLFQKVVRKWNNRHNSTAIPQQNCCACHC